MVIPIANGIEYAGIPNAGAAKIVTAAIPVIVPQTLKPFSARVSPL